MTHERYRTGTILAGKFRIDRLLGRGGMGAVYAASHLGLGQRVAIKLLMDEAAGSPEATARFAQEAQIVSRLSSPHVVRVHDVGRSEWGEPFIVMEHLEGRDLASLIAAPAPIAIARAVDLVLQAAIGVSVAHACGLVHRDLKPANLFLARQADGGEVVKVLDFGLSKVVTAGDAGLTQSAASFGTPQYMAPEQIMSAKHVDARCDQHALAMILYELLAKRPAFIALTPAALTVTIVTKAAPSLRLIRQDVPRALDEALLRAMAKKPGDRFSDLGAFARAIAPFGPPGALEAASSIERTLRSSTTGGARLADGAFVSDDFVTLPKHPSVAGVSTRSLRLRSSALFWGASALIFVLAFGTTIVLMTVPNRNKPNAASQPSGLAADIGDSTAVEPTSAASSTESATPSPTPLLPTASAQDTSSSATPRASASARSGVKPHTIGKPVATAAPGPTHDPNDPINVFGRSP